MKFALIVYKLLISIFCLLLLMCFSTLKTNLSFLEEKNYITSKIWGLQKKDCIYNFYWSFYIYYLLTTPGSIKLNLRTPSFQQCWFLNFPGSLSPSSSCASFSGRSLPEAKPAAKRRGRPQGIGRTSPKRLQSSETMSKQERNKVNILI